MNKNSRLISDSTGEYDFFERFWLQIKSMKYLFLIPLLGYYGIVPLWVWAQSFRSDFYVLDAIREISFLIVPFISSLLKRVYRGGIKGNLAIGERNLSHGFYFVDNQCNLFFTVVSGRRYGSTNVVFTIVHSIFFIQWIGVFFCLLQWKHDGYDAVYSFVHSFIKLCVFTGDFFKSAFAVSIWRTGKSIFPG